jgi:hypothetical protein
VALHLPKPAPSGEARVGENRQLLLKTLEKSMLTIVDQAVFDLLHAKSINAADHKPRPPVRSTIACFTSPTCGRPVLAIIAAIAKHFLDLRLCICKEASATLRNELDRERINKQSN